MEVIEIRSEQDIVLARQLARDMAGRLGFSIVDKTRVATAVSELARNVYVHGGGGHMEIVELRESGKVCLCCTFVDDGPGIANIEQAMEDGFSTGSGLGQGLPGSRRLMDDMRIESKLGKGTKVEVFKWK